MSYEIKQTSNSNRSNENTSLPNIKSLQTSDNYYADTAYFQGQNDAFTTVVDKETFGYKERTRRKFDMPKEKFCAHIMPRTGKQALSIFHLFGEEKIKKKVGDDKIWEEYTWQTWRNKKAVWFQVSRVAFICIFIGIFVVIAGLTAHFDDMVYREQELFLFFIVPVLFYFFARYMTKVSGDKNNYIFNRRTGLVSIPRKGQQPFVRPFYEFIPYYTYQSVMHGANWFLYLGHRDEPLGALEPSGSKDPRTSFADWTFIQWFMDTSLPLPDIPELELYRHLDPTTAVYDKNTGRPEGYWRDMNYYKAEKLYYNECDRLNKFDANNANSWRVVPDDYMQWPHLVKLEPAEGTYEDLDAHFDLLEEKKKQKKLAKQKLKK